MEDIAAAAGVARPALYRYVTSRDEVIEAVIIQRVEELAENFRSLLDGYEYCADKGIAIAGGGQFELGPGRGQIQYLASLFHPDTPNDVAPRAYNNADPAPGLPTSPLQPAVSETGFRWDGS